MTKYTFFSSVILTNSIAAPFFNSISGYLDNVYAVNENELFKNIMGSHVPQVLFALGKFIAEGFMKRKLH